MHGTHTDSRTGKNPESLKRGFEEHLRYTLGTCGSGAGDSDLLTALAHTVRDRITDRWIKTRQNHRREDVKRVYYLSLEFLMGRSLAGNIINLDIKKEIEDALRDLGYDFREIEDTESDAGLGNGGLGRLAACFMDSLATLGYPAYGYGIRYDYGIFKQKIENGYQIEIPDDWLRNGNPWEIKRPDITVPVFFGGRVEVSEENRRMRYRWIGSEEITGVAYDTPIAGYGGNTVNTLRLWSSKAPVEFDLGDFNSGDYIEAVKEKVNAENITKVLYPNDKLYLGKELRLKQQYFFVACSLHDILRRFKESGKEWSRFPDYAAIQLNDTHPSIAVPELMRLLVDRENLEWTEAWDITVKSTGYTNHTLMPEALEKWPVPMMEKLLPRHMQIIYEINHRFLQQALLLFSGNTEKLAKVSIIEESSPKQVRMANLAITGSHSVNGVADLHTELLKKRLVPEFAELFKDRFNSKTNGITQRRWLLGANPHLAELITETIGKEWITDFFQLRRLKPYADDESFRKRFRTTKEKAKIRLSDSLKREYGITVNPGSIIDVQIKRIHEYKRQLLNALHIVILYSRIKNGTEKLSTPVTFLFGGKAAPGYERAKDIIKFINSIASVINNDKTVSPFVNVHFIPNYRVSLAEKIIPAADISQQISTAGTEASGTGNMKFMCNGALTLGTLDGANIEIVREAGEDNAVIFGLTAGEAESIRKNYDPYEYYKNNGEIKEALDLISSGYFGFPGPGTSDFIRKALFDERDRYLILADIESYSRAHKKARTMYEDRDNWDRKMILNIAAAGKFSSDRTIREYAEEIWNLKRYRIP